MDQGDVPANMDRTENGGVAVGERVVLRTRRRHPHEDERRCGCARKNKQTSQTFLLS